MNAQELGIRCIELNKAIKSFKELTGAYDITSFLDETEVALQARQFKELTKNLETITTYEKSEIRYPYKHEVTIEGVKLFCITDSSLNLNKEELGQEREED